MNNKENLEEKKRKENLLLNLFLKENLPCGPPTEIESASDKCPKTGFSKNAQIGKSKTKSWKNGNSHRYEVY